jgi:hypothetical protein
MSVMHLHVPGRSERRRYERPAHAAAAETDFLWCVVCEHAFHRQRFRRDGAQLRCPDPQCDGGLLFEPWEWTQVRSANPGYPTTPAADTAYPYFGGADAGESQH